MTRRDDEMTLDEAWAAAEAALPEGWTFWEVSGCPEIEYGGVVSEAHVFARVRVNNRLDEFGMVSEVAVTAPTLPAALLALAAQPACGRCGGPHQFDTSIASPLWNRVIREAGLPDYLCTTCIVWAFVRAGESFEAELYGDAVNVAEGVPTISVQVGSRPIDQSYGDLQAQLRDLSDQPSEPGETIDVVRLARALAKVGRGLGDTDEYTDAEWAADVAAEYAATHPSKEETVVEP